MKNTLWPSLAFLALTFACNNHSKTENHTGAEEEGMVEKEVRKPILEIACYEYNNDGNKISMEITSVDQQVTGNLKIAYAEKDANQGTFTGTLNGDKLTGSYTFHSEGIESKREVAFLVKDNQLIEGYGELNEDGTKFKDVSTIQYNSRMPLKKVECDE